MKTIWILGAGASKGHTKEMPAIDEFFSRARKMRIINESTQNFDNLKEYIDQSFGKNILKQDVNLDIEKVLTNLEIDIEKSDDVKFIAAKQEVLKLIREVFNGLSKGERNNKGEYHDFINGIEESDTIISFNWDLLLDNIFERKKILKAGYEKYDPHPQSLKSKVDNNHYHKTVYELSAFKRKVKYSNVAPPYRKYDNSKGYYLKLHGSIDWLYCSNKSCKGFGKCFPALDYHREHFCSECHKKLDYLLIPPVLNKKYDAYPFINKIWNKASKELQSAERLIVWGYSLPPTDFYSDWLLRQGRDSIKELILINPDCVNLESGNDICNKEFVNKFFKIFNSKSNLVQNEFKIDMYEYFSDFTDGTSIYEKYNNSEES